MALKTEGPAERRPSVFAGGGSAAFAPNAVKRPPGGATVSGR